jgi:hypothetical protein
MVKPDNGETNMQFLSIAFGLLSGVFAWMITEFVAKPFRRGIDLVAEVRTSAIIFGNVQARYRSSGTSGDGPFIKSDIPAEAEKRLQMAEEKFRELGAKLQAFAKTEPAATRFLRLLRIDMHIAGVALIGLSNSLGVYGKERSDANKAVESALRFES